MAKNDEPIFSIVMLLSNPYDLTLDEVERAAECAFEVLFNGENRIIHVPNSPMFVVRMPAMTLGVINVDKPYFTDIAQAADATRDVAAKMAIQQHRAWLSVDIMGDPSRVDRTEGYSAIGQLLAEFVQDGTLALVCTQTGQIVGYDACFRQLLQSGNALEVFKLGSVDRVIDTPADDPELASATKEALRRWPEFLQAFANRTPQQGFGVKKKFIEGDEVEHMWVEVLSIDGERLHGRLSNEPRSIRLMALGDPVSLKAGEIEDWLYTEGQRMVGGFQVSVLEKRKKRP